MALLFAKAAQLIHHRQECKDFSGVTYRLFSCTTANGAQAPSFWRKPEPSYGGEEGTANVQTGLAKDGSIKKSFS